MNNAFFYPLQHWWREKLKRSTVFILVWTQNIIFKDSEFVVIWVPKTDGSQPIIAIEKSMKILNEPYRILLEAVRTEF